MNSTIIQDTVKQIHNISLITLSEGSSEKPDSTVASNKNFVAAVLSNLKIAGLLLQVLAFHIVIFAAIMLIKGKIKSFKWYNLKNLYLIARQAIALFKDVIYTVKQKELPKNISSFNFRDFDFSSIVPQ
jgi:chaperone required for assembly of F1-ATPase